MSNLPDTFDARSVPPSQGTGGHPAGMFPFTITNTYLKENSAKTGAMLVVEMTSDVGKIENRYNVINPSPQAVEIAQKELSALCHAVNIFQVAFPKLPDGAPDMGNAGFTLRGGKGRMEVVPQTNKDGTPSGYMEVKKVFDSNGNEPGKGPSQPAPMQQQPNGGGWANNQPQAQPQQQPAPQAGGWAQQQPQQNAAAPANNPAPQQNGKPSWA